MYYNPITICEMEDTGYVICPIQKHEPHLTVSTEFPCAGYLWHRTISTLQLSGGDYTAANLMLDQFKANSGVVAAQHVSNAYAGVAPNYTWDLLPPILPPVLKTVTIGGAPYAYNLLYWDTSWNARGVCCVLEGYAGNLGGAQHSYHVWLTDDKYNLFRLNGVLFDLRTIQVAIPWYRIFKGVGPIIPPSGNLTSGSFLRVSRSPTSTPPLAPYNMADLTNFGGDQRNPDDFDNDISITVKNTACRVRVKVQNQTGVDLHALTDWAGQPTKQTISIPTYKPTTWITAATGFFGLGAGSNIEDRGALHLTNTTDEDVTIKLTDLMLSVRGFDDELQIRIASTEALFTDYPNPVRRARNNTVVGGHVIAAESVIRDNAFIAAGGTIFYYYGNTVFLTWIGRGSSYAYYGPRTVVLPAHKIMEINLYNDGAGLSGGFDLEVLPANAANISFNLTVPVGTTQLKVTEDIEYWSMETAGAVKANLRVLGSTTPK